MSGSPFEASEPVILKATKGTQAKMRRKLGT
jgi:hypothetical protein